MWKARHESWLLRVGDYSFIIVVKCACFGKADLLLLLLSAHNLNVFLNTFYYVASSSEMNIHYYSIDYPLANNK